MLKKMLMVLLAIITLVITSETASAAGEIYDYEFTDVNLYSEDTVLTYQFTNLDVTVSYSWSLEMVSDTGRTIGFLSSRESFGVATINITWAAQNGDFALSSGTPYMGAIHIRDNFGKVLENHFIAYGCTFSTTECLGESDFHETVIGEVNPITNRVGIGERFTFQTMNADGYWHPYNGDNLVTVRQGNYTLLHYRVISPSTDVYRIYKRNSSLHELEFSIAELIAYNTPTSLSALTSNYSNYSYVVLNTNGGTLPFINTTQNNAAFSGTWDNPHTATLDKGAYDYKRLTSGAVNVIDGESVLLVGSSNGGEWTIEANKPILAPLGFASVELRSKTGEIWSDGYITSTLTDSAVGVVDTSDYAFEVRRDFEYQVGAFATDLTTTWNIAPIHSNLFVATLSQRSFNATATYDILEDLAPAGRIEATLNGFGFDTNLGRSLALIIVIVAISLFMAIKGNVRAATPFYIVFMVVGGVWFAIGKGDAITAMIYGSVTMLMLFVMVRNLRSNSSGGGQGI